MQPRRGADESPTLRPPFDPEAYARDSEETLRVEGRDPLDSSRPTQPPPRDAPHYADVPESGMVQVSFYVESDDVPILKIARERVDTLSLSPLAQALLRHVNERDTVAILCARAGLRMDDAVTGLEELAGQGVVAFHRSTR
jgi:hypothetical protein